MKIFAYSEDEMQRILFFLRHLPQDDSAVKGIKNILLNKI
jgi:hypothetical protein